MSRGRWCLRATTSSMPSTCGANASTSSAASTGGMSKIMMRRGVSASSACTSSRHARRRQHLGGCDIGSKFGMTASRSIARRVHDALEARVAEQIVAQALLTAHAGQAEVVGHARPLQIQIDEEHPRVHVLRQRHRQIDAVSVLPSPA